ncbi:MAG: hypothetical protein NZ765_03645 [Anaerolineae bacterium]|nr:hypothetical protein [Anaerolineae bacterium]MDW8070648.1 hypothetical protein [Anaerolineae bacterium]
MPLKSLLLAALGGIVAAALLTGVVVHLTVSNLVPRLIPPGLASWFLLLFVLVFSLGELPPMILALRRMVRSASNPIGSALAMLTTAAFVFFAAFYAAPFTMLTGQVVIGIALAALCLLRLLCVWLFVPTV